MFWQKKKTIIIGDDYDDLLIGRLKAVLESEGAILIKKWRGLDVSHYRFRVKGKTLIVEAETYIGLSLSGPADLVMRLSAAVASLATV